MQALPQRVRPWLSALGLSLLLSAAHAGSPAPKLKESKPGLEAAMHEIYQRMDNNQLQLALEKATALTKAYPNFQLGHLILGDLYLLQTRRIAGLGSASGGDEETLKGLRAEAVVRLNALRQRPGPDQLPRGIIQLRSEQKHVLLVDTKRSRLFVYENLGDKIRLAADFYVTQGRLGAKKDKEGDDKTPLGVYTVVGHLPGSRLPEFYGAGALQINYPNDWDRLNGRGGSGIWLHGTPSAQFSRPPLASNGCVVLSNEDLNKLAGMVALGKTPVVISDNVEFISRTLWESERAEASRLFERWRADLESARPQQFTANYSDKFKAVSGENSHNWFMRQHLLPEMPKMLMTLKEVNFFRYPGVDGLIVGTFLQDAQIGKKHYSAWRRQYWKKEREEWRIVSEAML